jgi:hypothetical protein
VIGGDLLKPAANGKRPRGLRARAMRGVSEGYAEERFKGKSAHSAFCMKVLHTGILLFLTILFLLSCSGRAGAQQAPIQLIQKGQPVVVPGCGSSGCYAYHQVCVDVPAGAIPISIAQYYDSFSGWGEFTNQRQTATGFCATYVQHSHNVTRIVSFDVLYQPKNGPEEVALPAREAEMLAKLKLGERLSLSGSTRNISGNFLQVVVSQLKDNQALKTKGLEIDGAEFSDDVSITKTTVPFTVHLTNCRFAKPFSIQKAIFDGSVIIEDTSFEKSFQFQNAAIKEDLILSVRSSAPEQTPAFGIRDTHVDGLTEITTVTSGSVDNLKTGDLHVVVGIPVNVLSFAYLDANSFLIEGAVTRTGVKQLYATNSKINYSLRVIGIDIDNFRTVWTTVGELILSNTAIEKGFNLSFSTINSFEWAMGQNGTFPPKGSNDLTGVVFKNLKITHADAVESSATNTPSGPESAEVAKTSLQMLDGSQYSASAYDALEKLLAGRGDSQADEVFLAGREARRLSEIGTRPILGRFAWALDLFQEYVLGYGRIARWPILWSLVVIVVGFAFFWSESKMERKPEADSEYSRFWYSFELFVPVIDVGIASEWHPKPEYKVVANYARLHKLAGWILVPVILAALTGFAR